MLLFKCGSIPTRLPPRKKLKLFSVDHQLLASVELKSLSDTDRLARQLIEVLPPRCVIGVVGTLGAGKTRLTQALAIAAGVPQRDVTSPTFTLVHRYQGSTDQTARVLYHIDAYRIVDEDEFWELGVDEMFDEQAVTVVEWADRVVDLMPPETLWLQIALSDDGTIRTVHFTGRPSLWENLVATFART